MQRHLSLSLASIAALACGASARSDRLTGVINIEWVIAPPIFVPFNLPAAQSIDSIEIEIAHNNAHDLLIYVDALAIKGDMEFELMFQDFAEPPPGDDFSMGIMPENGTLANVARYTFVQSGGGGFTAPHTPQGTIDANLWHAGPFEPQKYILAIGDLEVIFDGGAVGTFTINYTPIAAAPGDVNGDGVVNVDDLLAVIMSWGPCPAPPDPCAPDLDHDGMVDVDDLLTVIGNWG